MTMSTKHRSRTVTVIYRFLPQYRLDFFNRLRQALADRGVILRLIYGKSSPAPRGDEVDLAWGTPIINRKFRIAGRDLLWQSLPGDVYDSDLIILMAESKILNNYVMLAKALFGKNKLAFWGHGVNFQSERNSMGNRVKRLYSTRVKWWFAYTEGVKQIVAGMGFPANRISVLNNAIDTQSLMREAQSIAPELLHALRNKLHIGEGPVGLYCGGMYTEKRLAFLLQTCDSVKKLIPGFEVIFVGSGEQANLVKEFCDGREWAHYVGPQFGLARVPYFMISDVFLMPGLVGLAVLDCFALQLPLATTSFPYHSPELAYLIDGDNAVITSNTPEDYTTGIVEILNSCELRTRLKEGCRTAANIYTLENMVDAFVHGVEQALAVDC
jgi:glycosyltransferase involved in cell wall biosynthesis